MRAKFKHIGRFGQSATRRIAYQDITQDCMGDGTRNYIDLEPIIRLMADYPESIISIEQLFKPVSFFELNYLE